MNILRLSAMAALLCFASVTSYAQNEGVDLLRKLEAKFQDVKSVAGSFTQTRTDPKFKTKMSQPATFQILKPNYFRAELQSANGGAPEVQLISNQTYYHYVPNLQQVATYKFKNESNVRDLNYLLLGFGAKADEVTKVYKVTALENGNGVRMVPRNAQEASFKYIIMEVDPQSLVPTRFSMEQSDGTPLSVQMNPQTIQLNVPLSPGNFQPNWPKGTHTARLD